jgi:hypothetical protein
LEGRDQEGLSLKPAWANSSKDPILKIPNTSRNGGERGIKKNDDERGEFDYDVL